MASGGIVGVEPLDTPGAYRAKLADGSSLMIHGQPGEDLYRRYSQSGMNATGPNALASNEPRMGTTTMERPSQQDEPFTPDEVMSGTGKGLLIANPITGPAALAYAGAKAAYNSLAGPDKAVEPTDIPPERTGPDTQQASAQAGPAGAQAPPAASQAGPMGYTMKGIDSVTGKEVQGPALRDERGNIQILVPGTRGAPGGLTKLGKEAIAHDAAAEAEAAKQRELENQARQSGADAAKQEAEERAAYLDEQRTQNMLAVQQQQDEQAKVEAQVGKLQASYDKARDDFMNSKVDPDQYMKSDKGRGIFSALGVMLNQFGSAFTHQPNVAAEFVNAQIDRNIRSQEAAINVKGKAADNMLADLTRQTGDLKLAKLTMRQLLTERAAIEAQQVGATAKVQATQANANEVAANLAGKNALLDNARKQGELEHVMSSPLYYQRGSAGTPTRFATPTQESAAKGEQLGIDLEKLKLEKAKAAEERGGKNLPAVASDRTEKIASYATALEAAESLKRELAGRGVTEKSIDDPTHGLYDRAAHVQSNEAINQSTQQLAKGLQSAFGKSDRDAQDALAMAEGGGSGRDRYQAADRNAKKLITNLRTELSTLPPDQARALLSTMPDSVKKQVLGEQQK